jgi:phenylpropionate dioxygenase-like ring-hydroxylating dioxygenase large terminal subunit
MTINFKGLQSQIEKGIVDPAIFLDEEIYQLELERVWKRSWLFVGHESMIPKAGDYITSYMGEDPVIVARDKHGKIRVMLNRCRHRGVKLCPYDRGNAKTFSCVYHGWVYGNDGALIAVPEFEKGYEGSLEKKDWGLIEIPQVACYGGFIYANGDAGAIPLEKYLGDLRYYFDNAFGRLYAGEIEMSPIKQRSRTHHNWKIAADNASDMYHFSGSHAGALQTIQDLHKFVDPKYDDTNYLATLHEGRSDRPSHSVVAAKFVADSEAYDLHIASRLGADSVQYVKRRYGMMDKLDERITRGYLTVAGIFPSMTVIDMGPLSVGVTMELYHPKGPRETETWLYVYVEKDAPPEFKKFAAQQGTRFHSFTGSVVPADHENWERLDEGIGTPASSKVGLNYTLGWGGSGGTDAFKAHRYQELPGKVEYCMSERGARSLYRHWANLMQEP